MSAAVLHADWASPEAVCISLDRQRPARERQGALFLVEELNVLLYTHGAGILATFRAFPAAIGARLR